MRLSVRSAAVAAALFALPVAASAQPGVGASLTPHAGYLVTGNWYDGPLGTNISATNAPMIGAAANIPLTRGVALVGSAAYAAGDLRVGLPILGGLNVAKTKTYLYDAGLELGGLAGRPTGIAPFVQAGIGGMTNDISQAGIELRSTNLAYTAGVGIDVGLARGFALRVQAKDWIGRFDSQEAVGFRANGNLAHNWALTAGVKLAF
jgi:hypothetical protein